jgi:periplasmic protein TonB
LNRSVFIQIIIIKEGKVEDALILRSINPELDNEALRVARTIPNWKPGKINGKPVRTKFTFPVRF